MSLTPNQRLARILTTARERLGISPRELAARTGVPRTTIQRLEIGDGVETPNPSLLASLAPALSLSLADLYAAASIQQPTELPSFAPYLRSRYRDLPDEAQAEIEQSFQNIASKYGYSPNGPLPGQDESDDLPGGNDASHKHSRPGSSTSHGRAPD